MDPSQSSSALIYFIAERLQNIFVQRKSSASREKKLENHCVSPVYSFTKAETSHA